MRQHQGFTLVELSIVLVILGLLVGGVLTGQSLIRAAELRSISTQYSTYSAAVNTFRDKYFGLPGDITNATAYWGSAGGNGSDVTCAATPSTDSKTCNGNGDGQILNVGNSNEWYRFWQQLANAGLIEGSYSGYGGANGYTADRTNSPVGKINSSVWSSGWQGTITGNPNAFNGEYGNLLGIAGIIPNNYSGGPILKPEEAYNVDMKMDDGKPGTGKIISGSTTLGIAACATTSDTSDLTAGYRLDSQTIACGLGFRNAF